MRIHFVISTEELPLYTELVKQLKSLGHNVTCGPDYIGEVDAVVCRGGALPVPMVQMEKLVDSVERAERQLKKRANSPLA